MKTAPSAPMAGLVSATERLPLLSTASGERQIRREGRGWLLGRNAAIIDLLETPEWRAAMSRDDLTNKEMDTAVERAERFQEELAQWRRDDPAACAVALFNRRHPVGQCTHLAGTDGSRPAVRIVKAATVVLCPPDARATFVGEDLDTGATRTYEIRVDQWNHLSIVV